jgi:uncharacterized protein
MPSPLPTPAPDVNPETEVFWSATADGRLLLPVCDGCGTVIWYPRTLCPACAGRAVTWTEASGAGTVFSFTVVHRAFGPYRDAAPYVLAYVELAEGPRVLTNIVGCEPDAVFIGQAVRVVFCDTGSGSALYRFEPVAP